jgi:hypothetical protein
VDGLVYYERANLSRNCNCTAAPGRLWLTDAPANHCRIEEPLDKTKKHASRLLSCRVAQTKNGIAPSTSRKLPRAPLEEYGQVLNPSCQIPRLDGCRILILRSMVYTRWVPRTATPKSLKIARMPDNRIGSPVMLHLTAGRLSRNT